MKKKQVLALSLATLMGVSTLGGAVTTVHAAENVSSPSIMTEFEKNFSDLDSFLKAEGISKSEWAAFIEYVRTETADMPQEKNGLASKIKNGLKFILNHIDVIPSTALIIFPKIFWKNYKCC